MPIFALSNWLDCDDNGICEYFAEEDRRLWKIFGSLDHFYTFLDHLRECNHFTVEYMFLWSWKKIAVGMI